jgi:hypothetical protein
MNSSLPKHHDGINDTIFANIPERPALTGPA